MTEQEALAIYHQGPEATVATLLAMDAQICELEHELAHLTTPLSSQKDVAMPSGMKPIYAKESRKRRRRKRPGRPKGHPGSRRLIPDRIDCVKEHKLGRCPLCHNSVGKSCEVRIRYTEEIPLVAAQVTEHRIYRYHCGYCDKIVEPIITEALPKSTISLRTLVFTSWLHYALGITLSKILRLLNTIAQFKVTAGGLIQAWHRLATLLQPAYEGLRQEAKLSATLHADETGWRVDGVTHWLWCFTNSRVVYYVIDRCRGSPVVKRFLGQFFAGVLITDFYNAYNSLVALAKQRCITHLMRELLKVDQTNTTVEWCRFKKTLRRLLRDALKLKEKRLSLERSTFEHKKEKIYQRFYRLGSHRYEDPDCQRLTNRLKRHRHELFTFLEHPDVPADNNHAERQIRPAVIARKNSYNNRSPKGANTQAVMMSLFQTLHIRGAEPIKTIMKLIENALMSEKQLTISENIIIKLFVF